MELIKKTGKKLCKGGNSYAYYGLFKCPYCKKEVERQFWRGKQSSSCGCVHQELINKKRIKHGHAKKYGGATRLYRIWAGMKRRCYNSKANDYKWYGGKGIRLCEEWSDFNNFKEWALLNGYTDKLTIDRKKSDLDYSPENCWFITSVENSRRGAAKKLDWGKVREIRKRSRGVKRGNLTALAKEYNVSFSTIYSVIKEQTWRGDEV